MIVSEAKFDLSLIDPKVEGEIVLTLRSDEDVEVCDGDDLDDGPYTVCWITLGEETLMEEGGNLGELIREGHMEFDHLSARIDKVFRRHGEGYAMLPGDVRYAIEMELKMLHETKAKNDAIAAEKAAMEICLADPNWGRF